MGTNILQGIGLPILMSRKGIIRGAFMQSFFFTRGIVEVIARHNPQHRPLCDKEMPLAVYDVDFGYLQTLIAYMTNNNIGMAICYYLLTLMLLGG